MDRTTLSAASIAELAALFAESLRENATALLGSDLDGIEQRLQVIARTVFGPVVQQTIMAIAATLPSEPPNCPQCRQLMRLVDGERPRHLQGLVGDYGIGRPYYVCDRCHHGYAPLDEHLGIGPGALSPGLARVACRVGIEGSSEAAVDTIKETLRVELSTEVVRRITEGIGAVAEAEAQEPVGLAEAGKDPLPKEVVNAETTTLLVEVDGVMVHEVDGDWHEVKNGLVAPLGPEDKETGRAILAMGKPSYCAGFECAEKFWSRVYVEAYRRGLGTGLVAMVVLLGDGADWIWHNGAAFLALERVRLVEIVDIYQAFEHLGTVARAVFGLGSAAGEAWLGPLKRRLEEEGARPVLAALTELRPGDKEAAEEVRKAIGYFTENEKRMDYPRFVAMKLPIGSGAIESTCKTLIEKREKGAGMRWTEAGGQAVATLRALHRSGRWGTFWRTHPQGRRPPVTLSRPAKDDRCPQSRQQAA